MTTNIRYDFVEEYIEKNLKSHKQMFLHCCPLDKTGLLLSLCSRARWHSGPLLSHISQQPLLLTPISFLSCNSLQPCSNQSPKRNGDQTEAGRTILTVYISLSLTQRPILRKTWRSWFNCAHQSFAHPLFLSCANLLAFARLPTWWPEGSRIT